MKSLFYHTLISFFAHILTLTAGANGELITYVPFNSDVFQNVCSNFFENQELCFANVRQKNLIKNESNIRLKLLCVQIYSATITWTTSRYDDKKDNTFAIQISSATNQSIAIYLVNNKDEQDFFQLKADTRYQVLILKITTSGLVLSNDVAEMEFTTLPDNWLPSKPSFFNLSNYIPINERVTNANFSWSFSNGDLPCYYIIYWWFNQNESNILQSSQQRNLKKPRSNEFIIPNLEYRGNYLISLAVILNDKTTRRKIYNETETMLNLVVPNCFKIFNSSKCAIPKPENLDAKYECSVESSKCIINISWTTADFQADFYAIKIGRIEFNRTDVSLYKEENVTNTNVTIPATPNVIYQIKVYTYKNKRASEPRIKEIYVLDEFKKNMEIRPQSSNYYLLSVIISIFALFILIATRIIHLKRQKHDSESTKTFYNVHINNIGTISSNTEVKKSDHKIHKYQLILGKMLGKGNFGIVFQGTLMMNSKKVMDVAVKTLQENATAKEIQQFEKEISLMEDVGYHNNIVCMIGSCYNVKKPLLIVEYCSLGDLHTYLCDIKKTLVNFSDFQPTVNRYENLERKNDEIAKHFVYNKIYGVTTKDVMVAELSICDLLSFGRQVTIGMEYLASNYVVHRDLAARNILLCNDKTVKISDFGLSRDIYAENIYRKLEGSERMPIKWMALESIRNQEYTTQSDVWSFGVFLWELFTMGDEPYPDISHPQVLYLKLKDGFRLSNPCPSIPELYDIMLKCWQEAPELRPQFSTLYDLLDQLLNECSSHQYITVTGNEN